ncbi:MAG: GNAT family N-acetyltransferase [Sedimentitalea sp.]
MEQSFEQAKIVVQDATRAHEDDIRSFSHRTHDVHHAGLPHRFGPDDSYKTALIDLAFDPIKARKKGLGCLIRVACRDPEILGYVMVIWTLEKDETSAGIADIGTFKAGRGLAVGALLLADLKDQMQQRGWHSLTSNVWQNNAPSHRLFRSADFQVEMTEYRFGTPPPLSQKPVKKTRRSAAMLVALVFLIVSVFFAYWG